MFTRFIHVVACVRTPFLFNAEGYFIVGTYHIDLSIFLINEHLGCFHALFIVKNAAMNRSVKISLPECVFNSLGCSLRSRIAGSYSPRIFICL